MPTSRALLLPLLLLAACGTNTTGQPDANTHEVRVHNHLHPCVGEGSFLCLVVSSGANQPWGLEYRGIQGLDFKWGHFYRLNVVSEADPTCPPGTQDCANNRLRVVDVLQDQPACTAATFTWHIRNPAQYRMGYTSPLTFSGAGGSLQDGTAFVCPDAAVCAAAQTLLGGQDPLFLVFDFGGADHGIQLTQAVAESQAGSGVGTAFGKAAVDPCMTGM